MITRGPAQLDCTVGGTMSAPRGAATGAGVATAGASGALCVEFQSRSAQLDFITVGDNNMSDPRRPA
jgi:hypothetical protein